MYTKDNLVVISLVQPVIYMKLKLNFPCSFKNVSFTYLVHKNMDLVKKTSVTFISDVFCCTGSLFYKIKSFF